MSREKKNIKSNNRIIGPTFTIGNNPGRTFVHYNWSAIPAWGPDAKTRIPDDTLTGHFEVDDNLDVFLYLNSYTGSLSHEFGNRFPARCAGWIHNFVWQGDRGDWPNVGEARFFDSLSVYNGDPPTAYANLGIENIFFVGNASQMEYEIIHHEEYDERITNYYISMHGYYEDAPPSPYHPVFPTPACVQFTSEWIPLHYYPCSVYNNNEKRFVSCDDAGHGLLLKTEGQWSDVKNRYGQPNPEDKGLIYKNNNVGFQKILKG